MRGPEQPTLLQLAADLELGKTSSRKLVEQSLQRIADPALEGARCFISVNAAGARVAADASDVQRKAGRAPSKFAGIPFSVKDLFDIAGEVTKAGSVVLKDAKPASADAVAIANLKAAGLVVIGRTNMTEFAYSGVGLNPHYGTPKSIYDRKVGRIPGGSSSGAAVAIADGLCALSIGTDTGGSCRIPAAFNGIVGFKPSAQRVSRKGVFPLAFSFDSIGSLAGSIACCAIADGFMAGDWDGMIADGPSRPLRLGVLSNYVLDGLDDQVAADFARAVAALTASGVVVEALTMPNLATIPQLIRFGGIVGCEAHFEHRENLAAKRDQYDPRVAGRMLAAAATSLPDYLNLLQARDGLVQDFASLAKGYDAVLLPAVAMVPPAISALAADEDYARINGLCLRNTYVANMLNACAISLPINKKGAAPTGLMLMAANGADKNLFSAAKTISYII